jgi:hypothetical protein
MLSTKDAFKEACRRGQVTQAIGDLLKLKITSYVFNQYIELIDGIELEPRLRGVICMKLASSNETMDEALDYYDRYHLDSLLVRKTLLLQLAKYELTPARVTVVRRLCEGDVAYEVYEQYLNERFALRYPAFYRSLLTKFYPHLKGMVERLIEQRTHAILMGVLIRFGDVVQRNLQLLTSNFRPSLLDQWVEVLKQYEVEIIPKLQGFLSEGRLNILYDYHMFLTEGFFYLNEPEFRLQGTYTYDGLKYWVDKGLVLRRPTLMDHIPSIKDRYKVWALLIPSHNDRRVLLAMNPDLKAYVQRVYQYAERGVNDQMPRGVPLSLQRYLM